MFHPAADSPAKTYRFQPYEVTSILRVDGQPELEKRIRRLSLSRRQEVSVGGAILTVDMSSDPVRILELDPEKKTAKVTTMPGVGPRKDPDMVRMALEVRDGSHEDIRTEDINGRRAIVYRGSRAREDFTVWLDLDTVLPLRIEMRQPFAKRTFVMKDFDFAVDFNEADFSTAAPEGYTVIP